MVTIRSFSVHRRSTPLALYAFCADYRPLVTNVPTGAIRGLPESSISPGRRVPFMVVVTADRVLCTVGNSGIAVELESDSSGSEVVEVPAEC
jgi:hypothetical protein